MSEEAPRPFHPLSDQEIEDMIRDGKPIPISEIVGGGYDEWWNTKKMFRIVRGSKGSKKSYTISLQYIVDMMRYPDANLLVIRKVERTLKDSVFATL